MTTNKIEKEIVRLCEQIFSQNKMKTFWEKMIADNNVLKYKKFGTIKAKLAKDGDVINTIIKGEKETETTTKEGDVIIFGILGERYVINKETFKKRYLGMPLTKSYQIYDSIGKTYAALWEDSNEEFIDSWGEDMIINTGDYLCSPTKKPNGQIYRIQKDAFIKTYKLDK